MTTRYAVEITVDITDLATDDEAHEICDLIEAAIGGWKPTVTFTTREYDARPAHPAPLQPAIKETP